MEMAALCNGVKINKDAFWTALRPYARLTDDKEFKVHFGAQKCWQQMLTTEETTLRRCLPATSGAKDGGHLNEMESPIG